MELSLLRKEGSQSVLEHSYYRICCSFCGEYCNRAI